jgi:frataxin-like iron-binding protein CyaY
VIDEASLEAANDNARTLLCGTQLDSFRVSSTVLEINFLRLPKARKLPLSIWLSVTGPAALLENEGIGSKIQSSHEKDAFFDARERLIGLLYRLIGETVITTSINFNGVLQVQFEHSSLALFYDDEPSEEVWAITSETPEPYADQSWVVCLTDEPNLVTHRSKEWL